MLKHDSYKKQTLILLSSSICEETCNMEKLMQRTSKTWLFIGS